MLYWPKKKAFLPKECSNLDVPHPTLNFGEIKRFITEIPCSAELHRRSIEGTFQIPMDYSAESLADLDELIQRNWPKAPARLDEIAHEFGCYLGQTIKRLHGGEWSYCTDGGWQLEQVGGQNITIFPFAKMRRRFLLGKEESLSVYHSFIRCQIQAKREDFEKASSQN